MALSPSLTSWVSERQESPLLARLAVDSTLPSQRVRYPQPYHGTSMIHSGNPSLPALSSQASSAPSQASVQTPRRGLSSRDRLLELDNSGALRIPPLRHSPKYECPFDFLDCRITFDRMDAWIEHSYTHFKNRPPPKENECRWCDKRFLRESGSDSWKELLKHVGELHNRLDHRLSHARPPFNLYRHLWKENIIDYVQFKELQGSSESRQHSSGNSYPGGSGSSSSTTESSPVTLTHTRREERNRRRRN